MSGMGLGDQAPPRRNSTDAFAKEVGPTWGSRLKGIEGLRGLAALAVVLDHTAQLHPVGGKFESLFEFTRYGLTLFFALSGFLLFRPFASAVLSGDRLPSSSRFLLNRLLRIAPGYVAIFVLSWLLLQTLVIRAGTLQHPAAAYGLLTDPLTVVLNLLLLQGYSPRTINTGIEPAWSLGVEAVFYVVLPLVSLIAMNFRRLRGVNRWVAVLVPPAVLFGLGIAGKVVSAVTMNRAQSSYWQLWGNSGHAVLERSFFVQADLFAWGMVAAVIVIATDRRNLSTKSRGRSRVVSLILLLGSLLVLVLPGGDEHVHDAIVSVGAAAAILLVVVPKASEKVSWVAQVLELGPFRYLGRISFSVYLWHYPVMIWLDERHLLPESGLIGVGGRFLIVSMATAGLASITYWLVEHQALKLKRSASRPTKKSALAIEDDAEALAAP
jgi:peptidoglycan/LPS O-acetylase OafA/YrhL